MLNATGLRASHGATNCVPAGRSGIPPFSGSRRRIHWQALRSALLTLLLVAPLSAWGVASPDTVVVVAKGLDLSSVALAEHY